ncbi:hypothetical protein IscW_ISCW003082 [Ixodes scapularis]|uniref:Uncharacterized protein n=1 Tax=Ixodes scapularis TaxID=6945 RepID=B7P972_IXOSC|nr:hypothetical protein IscW_ISCW003082 [Ixodes scapularis]|eukprot:XP_002403701.1 hypothetical protein IscW_ISCW003082 [Ixodes scapularis]
MHKDVFAVNWRCLAGLATVQAITVVLGILSVWDTVSYHHATGFGVCLFSTIPFVFLLIVVYSTALTIFIVLASPGIENLPAFQHACRMHYMLASSAFLVVLVFLVTHNDDIARETVRSRVIVMAIANMLVYCLLAFMA